MHNIIFVTILRYFMTKFINFVRFMWSLKRLLAADGHILVSNTSYSDVNINNLIQ